MTSETVDRDQRPFGPVFWPVFPRPAKLPHPSEPNIARLARLVGDGNALTLIERYGGTTIYVPHEAKGEQAITSAIGIAAARALSSEFGGNDLKVPLGRSWRVQVYRTAGCSLSRIARYLTITESTVGKILQQYGDRLPRSNDEDTDHAA